MGRRPGLARLLQPGYSGTHVREGQQACEEGVRLDAPSDPLPVGKCIFRLVQQIDHFAPREPASRVVIRFVTGLLKVHKGGSDIDDLRLECRPVQPGAEPCRATLFMSPWTKARARQ